MDMSISCKQCGAALTERDAFCTKCGARRSEQANSVAAQRFCTKCGAALAAETKFCTKCGATAGISTAIPAVAASGGRASSPSAASSGVTAGSPPPAVASGAPAAKSPRGIPKIALIAGGVVALVLIVAVIAGMISAARRAREKAQEMEAAQNFAKSLENLASSGNAAATKGNGQGNSSPSDINKSISDLANAANALAQNVQKQAGANPQNTIPASAGATSGSTSTSTPAPGPSQYSKTLSAIDDFSKKLHDLQMEAPDQKTSSAVNDLDSKLDQLSFTAERNADNSTTLKNVNKSLGDLNAAADKLVTPAFLTATDAALTPPPVPSGPPMVPVAGTGDPKHDWPLEYERTVGGPEADLVVRTGDVNNLGFGWPSNFDPFSGKSTPPHPWPNINQIPPQAPPGTDRIMLGTGVTPVHMHIEHIPGKLDRIIVDSVTATTSGDGYSGAIEACYAARSSVPNTILGKQTTGHIQLPPGTDDSFLRVSRQTAADCTRERQLTMPTPIVLDVGHLPAKINTVLVQIFADDFQAPVYHSHFQVSLNGTRIPTFEYVINSLDQSGPIGKLVTMRLLPEYWPLLKSGTVKLLIDDPTTHVQDGYAVDFVRILVNPHKFKYQVSLTVSVTDADKHTPIPGATVSVGTASIATDQQGKCELKGIPAGLVVATANAPGYDENSVPVDLPAGQNGSADIQLHRHQESTAALEKSIQQTGTATIYGIHFDTGSSKLRADSMPALNAVLGLINGRPGSNWIIAGHTDNQGSDSLNIPLSKARAASVVSWLTSHGVAANRLQPQGFGSTRPVADNATAAGRALNRRVEVSLAK
jgi:OOP family OmpA-OmpF porin